MLAHLGAGESFGERGLLDNAPRNATVTTEVDTTVLRIEGAVLLEALERAPMLTTALNRSNAGRGVVDVAADETQLIDDPRWTERVTIDGATVVVVGTGYPGKRRVYERMAELGARLVIVDEAGHWSERLVDDGVASALDRGADHGRRRPGCREQYSMHCPWSGSGRMPY